MKQSYSVVMTWNYHDITEGTVIYTVSAENSTQACRKAQELAARDAHKSACTNECRCPPERDWDETYVALEIIEGANIEASGAMLSALKALHFHWKADPAIFRSLIPYDLRVQILKAMSSGEKTHS